jgi:hypothetical protein
MYSSSLRGTSAVVVAPADSNRVPVDVSALVEHQQASLGQRPPQRFLQSRDVVNLAKITRWHLCVDVTCVVDFSEHDRHDVGHVGRGHLVRVLKLRMGAVEVPDIGLMQAERNFEAIALEVHEPARPEARTLFNDAASHALSVRQRLHRATRPAFPTVAAGPLRIMITAARFDLRRRVTRRITGSAAAACGLGRTEAGQTFVNPEPFGKNERDALAVDADW